MKWHVNNHSNFQHWNQDMHCSINLIWILNNYTKIRNWLHELYVANSLFQWDGCCCLFFTRSEILGLKDDGTKRKSFSISSRLRCFVFRTTRGENPALQIYVIEKERIKRSASSPTFGYRGRCFTQTLPTSLFQSLFAHESHFKSMAFSCSDSSNN